MDIPKVFISYAWENNDHKSWVKQLAVRLRGEGVETILDQWELAPGDQLSVFMERAVRTCDFVLIVCTPAYRDKSDNRTGGVGYEGDIMTAEVSTGADRRKFIPLLRADTWKLAAPSWLRGSYYIDLRGKPYSEDNYNDLLHTVLDRREKAPAVEDRNGAGHEEPIASESDVFDIPSPVEAYMRVRAWLDGKTSKFPIAVEPAKVGWYPASAKSGAGYFYDDVLEYRVWIHPRDGGPELEEGDANVYFCAFPSYEEALKFSKETPGAEEPLVLVRQIEHINEPQQGKYIHIVGDRVTEWRVEWLEGSKRGPNSIPEFIKANNA